MITSDFKYKALLQFARGLLSKSEEKHIDKTIIIVYNISVINQTYTSSGCRVTVTHQFWELGQAGSTPVIPTIGHAVDAG